MLKVLADHPDIQRKLREEVTSFPHGMPTWEDLNGLQYLEAVSMPPHEGLYGYTHSKETFLSYKFVRESLRLHPPVPNTVRTCHKEGGDLVALSLPTKGDFASLPRHPSR